MMESDGEGKRRVSTALPEGDQEGESWLEALRRPGDRMASRASPGRGAFFLFLGLWMALSGQPVWSQPGPPPAAVAAPPPPDPAGIAHSKLTSPARLEALLTALKARAPLPEGLVPLYEAWSIAEESGAMERVEGEARLLLESSSTHPLVEGHLEFLLAQADLRQGRPEEARSRLLRSGFLGEWQVIGPFANYGYSQFDTALPPEGTDCEKECLDQEKVRTWMEFPGLSTGGRINLASLFENQDEQIAYARTWIRVDKPVTASLRVGADDGVVVWLNGQEVIRDRSRKGAWPDQRSTLVRLGTGWNEVRVKVANEEGGWGFFLRLTRPDGGPLPGWIQGIHPGELRAKPSPLPARSPALVDPFLLLESKISNDFNNFQARFDLAALTWHWNRSDRETDDDSRLAQEAVDLAPASAEGWWILARATDLDPDLKRKALEETLRLDPSQEEAALLLARLHLQRDRLDLFYRIFQEGLRRFPNSAGFASLMADRLGEAGAREAECSHRELLVKDLPAFPSAMASLSTCPQMRGKEGNAAALKRLFELDQRDPGPLRSLASLAMRKNDVEEAVRLHQQIHALSPNSVEAALTHARFMASLGRNGEAVELLNRASRDFPPHSQVQQERGDALALLGRNEEALPAWQESLAIHPENPSLLSLLERLAGASDPLQEAWARSIETLPLDHGHPAEMGGRGLRVLLALKVTDVNPSRQTTSFQQSVLLVESAEVGKGLTSIPIPYDDDLERVRVLVAEIRKPDGRRVKARSIQDRSYTTQGSGMWHAGRRVTVEFEPPGVGDMVHLQWKSEPRAATHRFDDFFGAILGIQDGFPVVEHSYTLLTPEGMEIHEGRRGVDPPTVRQEGGKVIRSYRILDIPAWVNEPGGPGYFDQGPYISVSNFKEWEQMAEWWANLIAPQFVLGPEGEAQARALVDGKETVLDKVQAIYEYVQRTTHYIGLEFGIHGWKPYSARQVFDRKYGDCKDKALLINAMLETVGIPAEMVIVATVGRGEVPQHPPNLFLFDHAIAYVPSLDLYLDATVEKAPMNALRWDDQGAVAVRVDRQGRGTLVHIPISPPQSNRSVSNVKLEVSTDGTASFREDWTETGIEVASLRTTYQDEHRWKEQVERDYRGRLAGVDVGAVSIQGIQGTGPQVTFQIEGKVPGYARPQGNGLELPGCLFPDNWASTVAGSGTRRTDLVFKGTSDIERQVDFIPPPGFTVTSLPADLELAGPHLSYRREVRKTETGATIVERLVRDSRRILVSDYAAFREVVLQVDRAQKETVCLQPGPPSPGPHGDQGQHQGGPL